MANNLINGLQKKVISKQAFVGVVGLGYVGLPLAVEFARCGFSVLGIDVDTDRVSHIRRKESYITDITTSELREVIKTGRFNVTGDFRAVHKLDVVIICVPTPLKRKYHPDISFIKQAVNSIAKNLKPGTLVILESTTFPGTTEEVILPLLEKCGHRHNQDFYLCFSPERIDPGNKDYPVHKIPKVIGGMSPEATRLAASLYKNIINKVVPVSSARVAEAVKLLENTFRLINIGLIDEMAMMAHKMDMNIWEIIEAASTKPFGFMSFYPGPGVGGHCIPKDPLYLYWKAKHHGFRSRFIKLASDITMNMPAYVTERVAELIKRQAPGAEHKPEVLVVGVTYKKDVKDLRKSPALDIIDSFHKKNIRVSYHDPIIPYLKFNHTDLKSIKLTKERLARFDCVVIATDHTGVDYKLILKSSKLIFDTRNVYKGKANGKVFRL